MKFSEKDIQEYIWENRLNWHSLIGDLDLPQLHEFSYGVTNPTPDCLLHNLTVKRLQEIYELISGLNFLGREVPLSRAEQSTIRADFIALSSCQDRMIVMELKKSIQTERQSFTELLAYSNHLKITFPGMTKEDIVYVLIAPMQTRIVKEAFIQTLVFDKRPIFAFVPEFSDENDISTLRLTPWIPTINEMVNFTRTTFHPCNLDIVKMYWEYSENFWDPPIGEQIKDHQVGRLNSISSMAAQVMEQKGINGFAYCSQTWPELSPMLPYTNSLVVVGINPYSVISEIYSIEFDKERKTSKYYSRTVPNISEIISGLKNQNLNLEESLERLQRGWKSQIFDLAFQTAKLATRTVDGEVFIEYTSMTWGEYQKLIFEDGSCSSFSARPTGIIRELFWEVVDLDYGLAERTVTEEELENMDMYFNAIETLDDNWAFRQFIERMFGGNLNLNFRPVIDNAYRVENWRNNDVDDADELPW
jgi:hypothetical protein